MENETGNIGLESPIESEEGGWQTVKVQQVPYPTGFKSQLGPGKTFAVNGEIFEVYEEKSWKNGGPRFLIRGIGIIAVVEEPKLEVTFEEALEAAETGVTDYMRGEAGEPEEKEADAQEFQTSS